MKLFISILFFLIQINASDIIKVDNLTFGYGNSVEDIDIYRVTTRKDLNEYFFGTTSDFFPKYYEASWGYWRGENGDALGALSFTPIFRSTFFENYAISPYIEAGLGSTYITERKLQEENFGVHFQFESLLGFGFKLDDMEITYRYMHYSNLWHGHNSGITLNYISFTYSF